MSFNPFSVSATLDCYPEDELADMIESELAAALPSLEALEPGMTQAQRLVVYQTETAKARSTFCALYGDPFGCGDNAPVTRAPESETIGHFVAELVML